MHIIKNSKDYNRDKSCVLAIGKFDGLHIGHLELLRILIDEGHKRGLETVVLTFSPSPEVFFSKGLHRDIYEESYKLHQLEKAGVNETVILPFDQETAETEAEYFLDRYIMNQLKAVCIVAGSDVSFGHYGKGNADFLRRKQSLYHYDLKLIEKVEADGTKVSSTAIRNALQKGKMELVGTLLGRPYEIEGEVIHGNHLGHSLDMPTINIALNQGNALPAYGVYVSLTFVEENIYHSVTNIGRKPSVGEGYPVNAETYLDRYDGDLYGEKARIILLHYIREEKRFDSMEELKSQLHTDKKIMSEYFKCMKDGEKNTFFQ